MPYDRVGIKKLRENPAEAFVIFWVHETGAAFYRLPDDFTEAGARSELGTLGCMQEDIDLGIAGARKAFELKQSRWKF